MCGLASRILAAVFQTLDSAQPVPEVQNVGMAENDVSWINSEGMG